MDTVDPSGVLPGPAIVPPWRPPLPAPLAQPRSNCDSGCLPLPGSHRRVSGPQRAARVAALLGAVAGGLLLLPLLPFLTSSGRQAAGRKWARAVLAAAGVRLVVRGAGVVPRRRALLVANHNSWLDTVALMAVSPARMTAKHDIRHWPVIGVLAAMVGTIFIDRRQPRRLPVTVGRITEALRADGLVAVFPAGTTSCGTADGPGHRADNSLTGRWRPAVFQAAVDAQAVVVPIRIGYREGPTGRDSTIATFLSAESLVACVLRVISVRGLVAVVTIEPALHPGVEADRRVLARAAEGVIRPRRQTAGVSPVVTPSLVVPPSPFAASSEAVVRSPIVAPSLDVGTFPTVAASQAVTFQTAATVQAGGALQAAVSADTSPPDASSVSAGVSADSSVPAALPVSAVSATEAAPASGAQAAAVPAGAAVLERLDLAA